MIDTSDKYLLMIEPVNQPTTPIDDDMTQLAKDIFATATIGGHTRGFHICSCGAVSDSTIWILPDGCETNSLMVHYVSEHRNDIPKSEIDKLYRIACGVIFPPDALIPLIAELRNTYRLKFGYDYSVVQSYGKTIVLANMSYKDTIAERAASHNIDIDEWHVFNNRSLPKSHQRLEL